MSERRRAKRRLGTAAAFALEGEGGDSSGAVTAIAAGFWVWLGLFEGAPAEEGFLFVDEGAAGEVVGEGVGGGDGEFDVDACVAEGGVLGGAFADESDLVFDADGIGFDFVETAEAHAGGAEALVEEVEGVLACGAGGVGEGGVGEVSGDGVAFGGEGVWGAEGGAVVEVVASDEEFEVEPEEVFAWSDDCGARAWGEVAEPGDEGVHGVVALAG